jgi:hypothetical protein
MIDQINDEELLNKLNEKHNTIYHKVKGKKGIVLNVFETKRNIL